MSKAQVVVFGRNYTSLLGMIRAIGSAGYDVTVIKTVKKIPNTRCVKYILKRILLGKSIEESSKYVKKYLYASDSDRKKLVELLLKQFENAEEKIVLIPTDDFVASTIDLYQDELREKFLFPNISNKKGEIVRIMDKATQKELAIQAGLNVAKGYVIEFENNKYNMPKDIIYPIFTKPQTSFKGDKTLMKRCNTEEELKQILKMAQKYNCPILAEQFIDIQKEYGVLGCSYNNEVIIPGIIEKIKTGNGSHKGVTLIGEVSSISQYDALQKQLKDFISSINFNGLFDIDLYENNGIIYFNELNLRFGAAGYGITAAGINLPEIFINNLLNIPNKELNEINNLRFVSDNVNLEDYAAGYISWKEYKEIYNEVDVRFIKSDDDIKPYRNFKRKEFIVHIKNNMKRGK